MIIDELNKKIADIESLANDKTSTIESKVSDLTDGLLMVADAVDIIPEMVDEKITAITKEFSTIKDSVSKVKAQKGDNGRDGINGLDGLNGTNGKDGSPDKPKDIADKLNTLENALDPKVIKGYEEYVNKKDLDKSISQLQNQTSFLIQSNRGSTSTSGVSSINGLTDAVTFSAGSNVTITESGQDINIAANFTQEGKYMISGGATWSGSGLTYDVSFLNYFFNGLKTANPDSVTLAASDPTDSRIDAIVVDEAGAITVITGTPSSSPALPPIPEDQLQVQFIIVEAGSTQPTIAQEIIYKDDPTTDWTFSTYSTATPTTGTINFAGTNTPFEGVNDIEASTDLRLGARFVKTTSFDPYLYTMYQVRVRFTGTAVASNKALNIRFENSAGTLVGNTINLFNYGLQRGVLNDWQLVVVPLSAFGALPTTVKGFKMIMAGGTVGQVRQWDVDYMLLTDGSTPYTNIPTIAFYNNGLGFASQSGLDLIPGTGITISSINDVVNQRVRYTINASGGVSDGDKGDITVSGSGTIWTIDNSAVTLGKISSSGASSGNAIIYNGSSIAWGTPASSITADATYNNLFSGTLSAGAALNGGSGGINNTMLNYQAGQNVTTGNNNNFIGYQAGKGATTGVSHSNFFGYQTGLNATSAINSIFIGRQAGSGATSASFASFLGRSAGLNATGAQYGIFVGDNAGNTASGSSNAVFIGQNAGYQATTAPYTIGIGTSAGYQASGATTATFIGYAAGYTASDADYANMIGRGAGNAATNAQYSNFLGFQAGYNATNAKNSIFIGQNAGLNDTVNNVASGSSIAIGDSAGTGGFSNSIALGASAVNTKANQFMIGSSIDTIVLPVEKTPSSASDTGTKGTICWDANYVYVCTATNTWKRSAIATW